MSVTTVDMDENSKTERSLTASTGIPAHHKPNQVSLQNRIDPKTNPRHVREFEAEFGKHKESSVSGATYTESHFGLISSVEKPGTSADETAISSTRPLEVADGVTDSLEIKGDCAVESQQKTCHDGEDESTPIQKPTDLADSNDPEVQKYIDGLMKSLKPLKDEKIEEEEDKAVKLKRRSRMRKSKKDFVDPGYDSEKDDMGPPGDQQQGGEETLEAFESGLQASAEARAASEVTRSTDMEEEFRAFQDKMMSSAKTQVAKRGREEQIDADTPSHESASKRMLLLKAGRSIRTI